MTDAAAPAEMTLAERQVAMLGELATLGMEAGRIIVGKAAQDGSAETALAFDRVSRAVRLTLMLQKRVKAEAQREETGRDETGDVAVERRKARVERIVERLCIAEHPDDEDAVDALVFEAGERLDDEDLYGDLMDRPVGEIVVRICKDLGLALRREALSHELWARELWPQDLKDEDLKTHDPEVQPEMASATPSWVEAHGPADWFGPAPGLAGDSS